MRKKHHRQMHQTRKKMVTMLVHVETDLSQLCVDVFAQSFHFVDEYEGKGV